MLRKLTAAIVLSGMIAGLAHAGGQPQTGINGSMHDMNSITGTTKDIFGRTCVFCHTPHNAQQTPNTPNAPLWNRADVAANLVTPYSWSTPANLSVDGGLTAALPFADDPLIGPTRLCMSCHDGTIAMDSHRSKGGTAGTQVMGTSNHAYISLDLTVTHPIGFKYTDAVTARTTSELVPTSVGFLTAPSTSFTATSFNTSSRGSLTKSSLKIADTLYGGEYMTCATCHDVHNTVNAKSDTGQTYNYFLRAREEGSAICLSCHIK